MRGRIEQARQGRPDPDRHMQRFASWQSAEKANKRVAPISGWSIDTATLADWHREA